MNSQKVKSTANSESPAGVQGGEMLTLKKACEYLGVSKYTIYTLIRERELPHYRINHKLVYFRASELDAYLQGYRVKSQGELQKQASELCNDIRG